MGSIQDGPVRHIVIFEYTKEAAESDIADVTNAFRALKDLIPGILSFETGVNNSPEGLNLGFTHVYLLTFQNIEARDNYLPHEEHEKFKKLVESLGILVRPFVVDYIPQD